MVKRTLILLSFWIAVWSVSAHEGMWIPALLKSLNEPQMKQLGLKLSADDIYAVNQSSLKDAIVHFGGFCTGEIISDQGLVLTNHHCGYGSIQSHSSVDNDLLTHGFWAKNKSEELANPSLFATFIVSIEDVTQQVFAGTADLENPEPVLRRNIAEVTENANAEEGIQAYVRAFYYGNQYFLIRTKTYNDVRLVGAPPSAVGKFGGDTDNWIWPRHTGDFSMFRIYADANNEPAAYSEDNVPFTPKEYLPISMQGSDDGDFAMVYGFPGSTNHFATSSETQFITDVLNPVRIAMRDASLEVINEAMAASDKTRIQYAAKQSGISNAWKKWRGQSRGLRMFNAVAKKAAFEKAYMKRADETGNLKYQDALQSLLQYEEKAAEITLARNIFIEFIYRGAEIMRFAYGFDKLKEQFEAGAGDTELEVLKEQLSGRLPGFFKDYDAQVDLQVMLAQLPLVKENLLPKYQPSWMQETSVTELENWAKKLYEKTVFTSEVTLKEVLSKPGDAGLKKLFKDPVFEAMKAMYQQYFEAIAPEYEVMGEEKEGLKQAYVAGILDMFPETNPWPDANSTLRLSYGKVEGSEPKDGVIYEPQTTMAGLLAKYIPGDRDFDLPDRLLELGKAKDFGPYANANGELVVCFTSSNHTSGGNSGSPVINGKGHLIGLNFDRSWESTMSDIMFDPDICRNIAVDMRYILFIVDKYANAPHLIEEMELVSSISE